MYVRRQLRKAKSLFRKSGKFKLLNVDIVCCGENSSDLFYIQCCIIPLSLSSDIAIFPKTTFSNVVKLCGFLVSSYSKGFK
ncbi:hypothetical protein GWI33_001446 [Rhynchophorus ferrugineus]|uniref:Uncharacterized protein n=1 Tax=Rhynchophorus ferrugineus TaxID=354439 RepID=A0A834IW64_RHYFE|nr:hypothetical protein GWI33_001446 [Rhynchophorus ferrugineus]